MSASGPAGQHPITPPWPATQLVDQHDIGQENSASLEAFSTLLVSWADQQAYYHVHRGCHPAYHFDDE